MCKVWSSGRYPTKRLWPGTNPRSARRISPPGACRTHSSSETTAACGFAAEFALHAAPASSGHHALRPATQTSSPETGPRPELVSLTCSQSSLPRAPIKAPVSTILTIAPAASASACERGARNAKSVAETRNGKGPDPVAKTAPCCTLKSAGAAAWNQWPSKGSSVTLRRVFRRRP
jgi:hypothetical protein